MTSRSQKTVSKRQKVCPVCAAVGSQHHQACPNRGA